MAPAVGTYAFSGRASELRKGAATFGELGLVCVLEGHEFRDGGPEYVKVQQADAWSGMGRIFWVERERKREVN